MKKKFVLVLLILVYSIVGMVPNNSINYSEINLAPNQISAWFKNDGSVNSWTDSNSAPIGFEWPKNSEKNAISTAGLMLGCKIHDSLRLAIAFNDYHNEFYPGYTDYSSQIPQGKDDPNFRIYKISPLYPQGSNGFDSWTIWPVDQGAPWIDNNHNGIYEPPSDKPLMKSDENMFCAYTDSYIESHTNYAGSTKPMNADVHFYCYGSSNPQCADAIYMEWTIINKKNVQWDSLFVALWADPDLGVGYNDKTGCDTNLNIGFNYNGSADFIYNPLHPCFAYGIFEVSRHTGKLMDIFNDPKKNLYEPVNSTQTWSVLQGRKNNNSGWVNPFNNQVTKLLYTGDPETGSGWLYGTSNDTRMLLGSYIGTVVPLDTIRFYTVGFVKSGLNDSNAVTQLKDCYHQGVIGIKHETTEVPNKFSLYQNYPNPFNPTTQIKFEIPLSKYGSRGLSAKLMIYNAIGQQIATLINEQLKPGTYSIDWNASNFPSGVYFYKLVLGENTTNGVFTETKKMVLLK